MKIEELKKFGIGTEIKINDELYTLKYTLWTNSLMFWGKERAYTLKAVSEMNFKVIKAVYK